ncbi:hypothetical protein [Streptodolium elevatio]|uniref:Uncharacterized protein n=1 Tax=Streptodolium elevatio TaxID=3157996 RepID=A0ABV3DVF2_9ACTN
MAGTAVGLALGLTLFVGPVAGAAPSGPAAGAAQAQTGAAVQGAPAEQLPQAPSSVAKAENPVAHAPAAKPKKKKKKKSKFGVGLIIGIVLVVLVVGILVFFLMKRRSRH